MSQQKPTVDELVQQVRNLSGLRSNQQCTDIEIAQYLTDASRELADKLIVRNQHYFTKPFDFALQSDSSGAANGGNVVELPEDFQRADAIDCIDSPSCPSSVPMLSSWLERNGPGAYSGIYPSGAGRRYTIQGGNGQTQILRMLPAQTAAGNYRLWYTPEYPSLLTAPSPVAGTGGSAVGTFRAPTTISGCSVAAAVNGTNLWTIDVGGFTSADVGSEFNPQGTAHSDGIYEILEVKSPTVILTRSNLIAEALPNGITVVIASTAIPVLWTIPGGAFDSSLIGGFISVSGFAGDNAPLNNRVHRISNVMTPTTLLTIGTGVMSNSTTGVTLLPYPALSRTDLPALLCPWSLYLVVHASIAVRTKRQQDTTDLQMKLQQQSLRIQQVTANKTSEVVQAPMQRRRLSRGYGNGWLP